MSTNASSIWWRGVGALALATALGAAEPGGRGKGPKQRRNEPALTFPPALPSGAARATDRSPAFLQPPAALAPGVSIARIPPTVDFMYFPGQDYPGRPWSNWGDSLAVGGKYYASIGDHLAPEGNAFIFEYDPRTRTMRRLLEVRAVLRLPSGHYTPGKLHSRIDQGVDGWLYVATHRGSVNATNDRHHYTGDWILRCHPVTGEAEIVVHAPVPKHCIPNGMLDPERLIFYGGTAPGERDDGEGIQFFAYDVRARKLLYSGPNGPARYMALAGSTGRVYYTAGKEGGALMRFDPAAPAAPVALPGEIGLRAATRETPQGVIYTVSPGRRGQEPILYALHTRTEKVEELGPAAVGAQGYIASIDADPTGRYLYYVAGAHGGSDEDGAAVAQFDTETRRRKVIAFLHPFYRDTYGATLRGTYSTAVDPDGDKLYITWNVSRGGRAWDSCALTVIHIPISERVP